jgi:micrococcal nuclease
LQTAVAFTVLLLVLLSACGGPVSTVTGATPAATLPRSTATAMMDPVASSTARPPAPTADACAGFASRIWAQTVFDDNPARHAGLDPDRDGVVCEELALGAAPALWTETVPANAAPVELARVSDGDTIEVVIAGVREPVRLIGVDAPETGGPFGDVECFGAEAAAFLAWLLGQGGQLALEKDQEERDRFGRLLRWVWLDRGQGEVYLVNEALIRAGYAERFRDTPNRRYVDEVVAAETFARRHDLGLWDRCEREPAR